MQLPSIGPKGERQVRTGPSVPLGAAGAPTVVHKVLLRSSFQAPDRKLITVRLQMPKIFQDEAGWAGFCKQPNDRARQALGPIHSFGPRRRSQAGDRIVKLCLSPMSKLLSRTSRLCQANQVPLGLSSRSSRDSPKPVADWVPAGEAEGPAYLALASRAAVEAKSSLAFRRGDGASLGVKVPADKAGDRVFSWRARQVPLDWSADSCRLHLVNWGSPLGRAKRLPTVTKLRPRSLQRAQPEATANGARQRSRFFLQAGPTLGAMFINAEVQGVAFSTWWERISLCIEITLTSMPHASWLSREVPP